MSKQKKEPAVEETAVEEPQTAVEETTATETPPEETEPTTEQTAEEKSADSSFVCPRCQHTTVVKLGTPYKQGESTLQLLKCAKCNHAYTEAIA